jgi:hypothetical protein
VATDSEPAAVPPPASERVALPSGAEIDDLRASLESVRRMLDQVDSPDPVDASSSGLPGGPGQLARPATRVPVRSIAVLVGGLVAAAAVAVVAVQLVVTPDPPGSPAGSQAPTSEGATRAAPPWPGSSSGVPAVLASTGPGIDAPGTDIVVATQERAVLEAYERVVLPSPGSDELTLTRFDRSRFPSITVGSGLTVADLSATTGGVPGRVQPTRNGWVVTDPRGGPVRQVVLRYRVFGATISTEGAKAGRALLLVWPLSAETSLRGGTPVIVRPDESRTRVREMLCPLAEPVDQYCGSARPAGWVGQIPARAVGPLMIVQVDTATE